MTQEQDIVKLRKKGMTIEQLKEIEAEVTESAPTVSAHEIFNHQPRTLLWGYTADRDSFHVYLDGTGIIHRVIYTRAGGEHVILSHMKGIELKAELLVPNKRTYPEATDFEFAKLLKDKGIRVSYTSYKEDREESDFYGLRYDQF
ncbi:hypothetical protein [Vibrio owensii]|uniref:hypothetical protein n=1 Tax=Vibrio harveyi group TaxID=717610 RepID=UPI003CC5979E